MLAGLSAPATLIEGVPSPRELAALLQQSTLFVGNDSGVMHLAAAVEIPIVAIFGPTNHRAWGPYPPDESRHAVVREPLACSPCIHRGHSFGGLPVLRPAPVWIWSTSKRCCRPPNACSPRLSGSRRLAEPMAIASRPGEPTAARCARHPAVETYLRCGRCDTPICPRCLVQTPVGTRCRNCARLRPSPPYDVSAPAMRSRRRGGPGRAWSAGPPYSSAAGRPPFGLLGGLLGGFLLGVGVARLIDLATNRKRGPLLSWLAVLAIAIGYCLGRSAIAYWPLPVLRDADRLVLAFAIGFQPDLGTLILLPVAGAMAFSRLR